MSKTMGLSSSTNFLLARRSILRANHGLRIRVANLADSVSSQQVVSLFSSQIGPIREFCECASSEGRSLELCFYSRDASRRALCLAGYMLGGNQISVTSLQSQSNGERRLDQKRNLYVLGLPFDLTKNELAEAFSECGKVLHCVILATVDNASRRRGFVVMSTHEEAKFAISRLSQTQLKGHTLDISWAVVQRSQGFLDGGDRNVGLDASISDCSLGSEPAVTEAPPSATSTIGGLPDAHCLTVALFPTNILLVKNLPTFLFSQISDLKPLFYPFGPIKQLKLLSASGIGPQNNSDTLRPSTDMLPDSVDTASAIVEFTSLSNAEDAKLSLHGQIYANLVVAVHFLGRPAPANDHFAATETYHGVPGYFLDPSPPFVYGSPHYAHRPVFYGSHVTGLPCYAAPAPYSLALVPPICTGHSSGHYADSPYAIHNAYARPSGWPRLDSRTSSLDSRLSLDSHYSPPGHVWRVSNHPPATPSFNPF
ncbi:RRM domain-containing protein [Pleurotus pulmonarius]